MPLYEYLCPECDQRFKARRSMGEASEPIDCPQGHVGSRRLLSMFASVGGSTASAPAMPSASGGGHGCGGGMCGC